jgi:glyoxylase-like metal-dependent hydrolase (beta-lactamase superfamily II)
MWKKIVATFCMFALSLAVSAAVFPVEILKLDEGLYLHRSYEIYEGRKTASNGLLVETGTHTVLIDTAWNDEETRGILDYARVVIGKPVLACLVTHSHEDRAGGLGAIAESGIPIYMTARTADLLSTGGRRYRASTLEPGPLVLESVTFDIVYIGPAHTSDNIAVSLRGGEVLFGGCMVKSLDALSISPAVDADLGHWPLAIKDLIAKYGRARLVIPGHGRPGGPELLTHTLALLDPEA